LNLSFQGSFLAATSGKSKALIIYPIKKEKNINDILNETIENKNQIEINSNDQNNIKSLDSLNNFEKNINKNDLIINEEIVKINNNIKLLENEKLTIIHQLNRNKNDKQSISEKINLNEKIDKINNLIEQLKLKILTLYLQVY